MARTHLPTEKILAILRETPQRLAELSIGLTAAQLWVAPSNNEWSINKVLAHLRACDDVWGGLYITTILARDKPTIKAVNPRTWIKSTNYVEQEFAVSLHEFAEQRTKLLSELEPLKPGDWMRTNLLIGAGKPIEQSLWSHADGLARHEHAHLKQIERIVAELRDGS